MKIIGLTGGIGTGKSTVEEIFKKLGCYVIDADKVVHSLYKDEIIKKKIKDLFTDEVFDEYGEIDRKKLAQIVFKDISKRKILESLIHPQVNRFIENWIEEISKKDPDAIVIVSVPLMIETGSYKKYDKIILVYATKDLQIKRLLKKGYTQEEAISRIDAQMDIDEKLKYADYVIYNTSTLEDLEREVKDVFEKIKSDC
ncbi:MAG: dephospho-CoA kinase [Hydrogenothermaceae bacterium]|nr:dephospho-CoA kinase [Hydrogenothermaceae bacterium]